MTPLDLVQLHPFEEAERAVGISELDPGLVLLLDEWVVILEYNVVEVLRVPFNELVIVHQINNVTCVHAALTIHFCQLLLLFIFFLCDLAFTSLLDCLVHVVFHSLWVAVLRGEQSSDMRLQIAK